ncbi:lysophospholipid acyltransferase family protein [Rivibacter subsaxonicus]|uniref:KDO2-lipid IV(A) lauroyltransferase n=1 Tax=Rivibacter subsaxonicus TaxID=457575 RepID=A0A4V2FUI4_9BURK|nr:lysophospholipid acyltransferase family protein [Rivibacter subsaxonicus]RZU02196.1 KDO2-lipid IV(A) lauroyltransferase [Rivibacter subsaxonicus]
MSAFVPGALRALLDTLAGWPLWLLHAIGSLVGWLTYLASPSYRRRFRANALQAGVPWSRARPAIAAAGRLMLELPPLWRRPQGAPLPMPVQWGGGEHVDAALGGAKGVLLLTPHLGGFEVIGQAYAERFGARAPATVLYRPARKPWLRELVDESRRRPRLDTAPATLAGVRQLIRTLRRGEVVGLLPDQVPPEGMGVWAPFFGKPAYTMTLAARLAQQTGCAVLLIWSERLPHGAGYRIEVLPLAEALPVAADDPDGVLAASAVNRAMEQLVRQCPEQYLWGYHRYKQPRAQAVAPPAPANPEP